MFDNFTKAKPKRTKLRLLAVVSGLAHGVAGALLVIAGLWEIEEVNRPNRGVAEARIIRGLPAPKAGGEKAPEKIVEKEKKRVVKDPRQPNAEAKTNAKASSSSSTGEGNGEGEGKGFGLGDGDPRIPGGLGICLVNCDGGGEPTVPVEKEEGPKDLPPTVLSELTRTAGDAQIQPPSSTKNEMARKSQSRIIAVLRMCLDKTGRVSRHSIYKSSGYQDYDAKLLSAVRRWRYEPYRANGNPVAICTHVTFIYQQE